MLEDHKSSILSDLLRYVPQIIVPALLAFLSVPVYTRLFNPSVYGDFNIVRVSNTLLDKASGWIGCSLTRYYNEYAKRNELGAILSTIINLNAVVGLLFTVPALLLLAVFDMTPELKNLFKIGLALFVVSLFYHTLTNVLRMERKINLVSIFVMSSSVASFALSLALIIFLGMSIESVLIANVAVYLILFPFLWRTSISGIFRMRLHIDSGLVKRFTTYGVPLTISSMGVWILDLSDRYVIKMMLNSYEVGVYSACYNIAWNSLFLVVNIFFMMEEPLGMKIFAKEGKEALARFVSCETRLFLMVIVPLTALLCFYRKEVLSLMVASKYAVGSAIVPYVAASVIAVGLAYKYQLGILAMERTKTLMSVVLVSGGANILLNILLVPRVGILGAGIATLASYILYLLLIVLSARKIFRWDFPLKSSLRITASAILAVYGFGLLLPVSTVLLKVVMAVLSVALYMIMLRLSREIDEAEMSSAKGFIRKWTRKAYASTGD